MTLPADAPARHDLVWLTQAGVAGACAGLSPADRALVGAWRERGRPLVRARGQPSNPPGWLPLGLPLPPSQDKRRLALKAPLDGVADWRPPPRLGEALGSASTSWRRALMVLDERARTVGLELRVFGSLAWQHLTGDAYVSEASDVDLLWRAADRGQLCAGLRLLRDWEQASGLRADGEVRLPGGDVSWRELAGAPSRVLVKSENAVTLWPLAAIDAGLSAPVSTR